MKAVLKLSGMALLIAGICGSAMAQLAPAPEIDPGLGINALALLGGAALIIRSRRK
jgi:hypothetical protein